MDYISYDIQICEPMRFAFRAVTMAPMEILFYYKEKLVSYLFAGMALLVQLLMAVGLGSVILINF